jgi:hypothetical protein
MMATGYALAGVLVFGGLVLGGAIVAGLYFLVAAARPDLMERRRRKGD